MWEDPALDLGRLLGARAYAGQATYATGTAAGYAVRTYVIIIIIELHQFDRIRFCLTAIAVL